jgi:hypothetical protein
MRCSTGVFQSGVKANLMENSFLIPLFFILMSILLYPALMIYIALVAGAGMFTWLILATMLSPYVALWYYIVKRRVLLYLKFLLDNKPRVWDIEKTMKEYLELLNRRKADK